MYIIVYIVRRARIIKLIDLKKGPQNFFGKNNPTPPLGKISTHATDLRVQNLVVLKHYIFHLLIPFMHTNFHDLNIFFKVNFPMKKLIPVSFKY